jgi:hypothetical protein
VRLETLSRKDIGYNGPVMPCVPGWSSNDARVCARRAALSLLLIAVGCRRAPESPRPPSPRVPADTPAVRPPPPRVETAAVFYGAYTPPLAGPDGRALLVAGDLRVEVAADGAVRTAPEAMPNTVNLRWALDDGRYGFITTDDQVLVTDGFLGPVVLHAAMPAAIVRHATGALPAVRTDDGAWHRITPTGPVPMPDLGAGVTAVHFDDDRAGWALRAPGEVLRTRDGGARWRVVPLAGDVALRFEFDPRGAPLVQGARARYAPQGDAMVATTVTPREPPDLDAATRERALAQWGAHWRAHRWPTGATGFWLQHEGRIHRAVEHRDALWWWDRGRVYALGRDGSVREGALPGPERCTLSRFGDALAAVCPADAFTRVFTVDVTTVTPTALGGLFPADAEVSLSEEGGAAVVHMPGFPGPHRVWTRAARSFQRLSGLPADARVLVEGDRLLALSSTGAQLGRLSPEGPRWTPMRLDSPADAAVADRAARVMSLRPDGGYAIAQRAAAGRGCEVLLGAEGESPVRAAVPGCEAPAAVAFADARFGVVVDGYTAWVTADAGARWTGYSRPVGGLRGDAPGLLASSFFARAEGDALYVAPGLRFTRSPAPQSPYRARGPFPLRYARPNSGHARQFCEATGAPRVTRPPAGDANSLTRLLAHEDAQATLTLRREGGAVRVTAAWRGGDGGGRFEGDAPWRDPVADFTRGDIVGYVLRGVSAAGALLERCQIEREGVTHNATACDVVWLTPQGQARPITLQEDRSGAGARVLRAAPDGDGWVLELGSGEMRRLFSWVQWQHRRGDGSLARWGDVNRDVQRVLDEDLARIGGRWGVRTVDGFFAHGERAPQPLPAPTTVGFCRAAPGDDADLWITQDSAVTAVPRLWLGGPATWVLRRGEEGWCITRGHDTTPMFDWSTASHRAFFPAWRLLPGGGGVRQEARPDGSFEVRAARCDPPPP